MPAMKLKVSAVTSSQPPHRTSPARTGSVRGARRVIHRPAPGRIRAAGISQAICPPISEPNILRMPVLPHMPEPVAPTPPPTEPVSLPVRRPKPL